MSKAEFLTAFCSSRVSLVRALVKLSAIRNSMATMNIFWGSLDRKCLENGDLIYPWLHLFSIEYRDLILSEGDNIVYLNHFTFRIKCKTNEYLIFCTKKLGRDRIPLARSGDVVDKDERPSEQVFFCRNSAFVAPNLPGRIEQLKHHPPVAFGRARHGGEC